MISIDATAYASGLYRIGPRRF